MCANASFEEPFGYLGIPGIMDWSSVVAGGITGLLSGAISGNLVQYILDKKRIRHRRRLEFLDLWRSTLNTSSNYSTIISDPSYEILEDLIAQKEKVALRQKIADTESQIKQLNFEFEVYGDYACNLGLDELYETTSADRSIHLPPYQDPVSELQTEMTRFLISTLRQELRKLEKKWGLL